MNKFTSKTWAKIAAVFVVIFALLFAGLMIFRAASSGASGNGPSYKITKYQGDMTLKSDNTATYVMHLTYQFSSSYNGQYVTFGKAGKTPAGFTPQLKTVTASRNAQSLRSENLQFTTSDEGDALVTKVYNAGSSGDKVDLTLTYQITNILWAYRDIFVMNWVPISDWDVPLQNVEFTVTAPESVATRMQPQLGYLNQKVKAVKSGKTWSFTVKKIPSGADLSLYARWDSQAFQAFAQNSPASVDKTSYLSAFEKKADSNDRNSSIYDTLFYFVVPVLLGLITLYLVWRVVRFTNRIAPKASLDDNLRLYEVPEDLPPLLVASHIYSSDVNELRPMAKTEPISFKNLIMATITDLIDRGVLAVDGETLKRTGQTDLLPSEAEALSMVMGSRQQINFDDAFIDYKMGSGYVSKEAEQEAGQAIKSDFESEVKRIAGAVRQDLAAKNLPDFFRRLSPRENNKMFFSNLALYLVAVLGIISLILTANKTFLAQPVFFELALIAEISLALPVAFFFSAIAFRLGRDGVITKEGAQAQLQWNAFSRMLREIAHLDDDKLESIKIWNRMLVFATMFGYADEVIKLINTRGIQLTGNLNNSNFGFYYPLYLGFGSSLNSTVQSFTAASSININTGGGGFSSGGGFSGGGGGGGGGAF
ncbi:DUF2207 family protein [Lactovum odontotermitis]